MPSAPAAGIRPSALAGTISSSRPVSRRPLRPGPGGLAAHAPLRAGSRALSLKTGTVRARYSAASSGCIVAFSVVIVAYFQLRGEMIRRRDGVPPGEVQREETRMPSIKCRLSRKKSRTEGTLAITAAVSTTFGPVEE